MELIDEPVQMIKVNSSSTQPTAMPMVEEEGDPPFSERLASSRARWNVLDLLEFFGKRAVTATLFCDFDMTWAEQTREELNAGASEHVTVTAFLLKSIAIAQRQHPVSRTGMLPWGRTVRFEEVVAGFTVERNVDGEPAVFFGEIERAEARELADIARELRRYCEDDLKDVSKLSQQVLFSRMPWILRLLIFWLGVQVPMLRVMCMRATFGLSSLGALGVTSVNGPAVCTSVFGIGAIQSRPVVRDGRVVVRKMMTVTLSYDQRVMDGPQAARFLKEVRDLMEGSLAEHLTTVDPKDKGEEK